MTTSKSDMAIRALKLMILSGELHPGSRLPNEAVLSAQIGVSRNSLREAVRALAAMHILDIRQGDGTYVTALSPESLIETLNFAVDTAGPDSVLNFLELRSLLEVHTAQSAAARRSELKLAELTDIHRQIIEEDDPDKLIQLDQTFHEAISECAENPVLGALLRVVSGPTVRARIWRRKHADKSYETMRAEHTQILRAIAAKDVDAARVAMWNHINGVRRWVEENRDKMAIAPVEGLRGKGAE